MSLPPRCRPFLPKRRQRGGCHYASSKDLYPGFSLTLHPGLYCAVPLALGFRSSLYLRTSSFYVLRQIFQNRLSTYCIFILTDDIKRPCPHFFCLFSAQNKIFLIFFQNTYTKIAILHVIWLESSEIRTIRN